MATDREHVSNVVTKRVSRWNLILILVMFLRWTFQETLAFKEKIEEFIQIERPQENPQNAPFVSQSTESVTAPLWLIVREKREYNMRRTTALTFHV